MAGVAAAKKKHLVEIILPFRVANSVWACMASDALFDVVLPRVRACSRSFLRFASVSSEVDEALPTAH